MAIEVKRAERWDPAWEKPMRSLSAASGVKVERTIGIYCGQRSYQDDGLQVWPVRQFFKALHAGEVFWRGGGSFKDFIENRKSIFGFSQYSMNRRRLCCGRQGQVRSAQNEPPVAIVADDRERSPEVIEYLRTIPGVAVGIARLAAGDYLADRRLLFERKTLRDLCISIVDGRLFRQMGALARTRTKAVLILEGTGKDVKRIAVRREAVQGALITVSLLQGIPVLRSMSPEETARLIVYAARQLQAVGMPGFQRPGYRPGSKKGRQLFILQGLPGVGRARALRLLEKFGSVEAVVRAEREELLAVEGVGAGTADRIRWAVSENRALYGYDPDPGI